MQIMSNQTTTKLIYNFQLVAMPLHAALVGFRSDISPSSLEPSLPSTSSFQNVFDPKLAAYLLDSDVGESPAELELSALFQRFGIVVNGSGCEAAAARRNSWELGKVAKVGSLCHQELKGLLKLCPILLSEMKRREGTLRLYHTLELPVAGLLAAMEARGVDADEAALTETSAAVDRRIAEVAALAQRLAGCRFNLASPDQVSSLLFSTLGIRHPSRAATEAAAEAGTSTESQTKRPSRHLSTSEEDLLLIKDLHPVVPLILEFRALSKIAGTYIAGLKPFLRVRGAAEMRQRHVPTAAQPLQQQSAHSSSSRGSRLIGSVTAVHANWNQTTVRTGRLSCSRPNLQNIPNRQTIGGIDINVRRAFRAAPGSVAVYVDVVR
jgi:DNA polymerase I-like protein with 3'-5' exonuclease and polymerase domains